jgi:hypothetical protein
MDVKLAPTSDTWIKQPTISEIHDVLRAAQA